LSVAATRARIPPEAYGEPVDELNPPVEEPIRLLICDDHRILTDTLAAVVATDPGLELIGTLSSPNEAVESIQRGHPHVVLMDIEFREGINGIEATRRIKEVSPETVVVIMTAHEDERLMARAVDAGASGFLKKTEGVDEFLGAIKAAAAGEILIDQDTLARLLPEMMREKEAREEAERLLDRLTPREREILELSARGLRTAEVARRLSISPQTVQTHVRNILAKLRVHSKLQAVAFAVRSGAISP
jgi:RNA polymerase sigma factor (sigma-70 family)